MAQVHALVRGKRAIGGVGAALTSPGTAWNTVMVIADSAVPCHALRRDRCTLSAVAQNELAALRAADQRHNPTASAHTEAATAKFERIKHILKRVRGAGVKFAGEQEQEPSVSGMAYKIYKQQIDMRAWTTG